jgi:hypothetical protein
VVRTSEQHDFAAVVVTADGRRLTVPFSQVAPTTSVRDALRLLALGLVGLITGSRRESGGRR